MIWGGLFAFQSKNLVSNMVEYDCPKKKQKDSEENNYM